MHFCRYSSPLGNILLAEEKDAIVYCQWEDTIDEQMITMWEEDKELNSVLLTEACCQLTEYFTQKRKTFNLPIRLKGTPFQLLAWEGLQQIPYGKTLSYAGLARQIGREKAARAVGNANHHNPLIDHHSLPYSCGKQWRIRRICRRNSSKSLVIRKRKGE